MKNIIYIYLFSLVFILILVRIEPDLSHTKHEKKKKNQTKYFGGNKLNNNEN